MRLYIMIILSVFVLATLNYGVYEKQKIKDHGETVLLELAPVDPRSLIQGDYMRLRYTIERTASGNEQLELPKRGYMVIRPDGNNVAQFVRIYDDELLQDGEKLIHFNNKRGLHIMPNSFMFQEGHAEHYDNARYGVFKFDGDDSHLLVGLANKDRKTIEVPE